MFQIEYSEGQNGLQDTLPVCLWQTDSALRRRNAPGKRSLIDWNFLLFIYANIFMLYTICSELYEEMEISLGTIDDAPETHEKKLNNYLFCVRHYLSRLEQTISDIGFADDGQEIYFHKYIYSQFSSWYIYHAELPPILTSVPVGTDVMMRDYYIQELGFMHRGFNHNRYTYEYFLADDNVKDSQFFLHRNYTPVSHIMLPAFTNPNFLTNHGPTFARFIAHERMQQFIIRRLRLFYLHSNDAFNVCSWNRCRVLY